jgi:hypothetical protein
MLAVYFMLVSFLALSSTPSVEAKCYTEFKLSFVGLNSVMSTISMRASDTCHFSCY